MTLSETTLRKAIGGAGCAKFFLARHEKGVVLRPGRRVSNSMLDYAARYSSGIYLFRI